MGSLTALDPELAAEYNRARLMGARPLIRMACLLGLVVTLLRIGELAEGYAAFRHQKLIGLRLMQ